MMQPYTNQQEKTTRRTYFKWLGIVSIGTAAGVVTGGMILAGLSRKETGEEESTGQNKTYLNKDFITTRMYAQSHPLSDFENYLNSINPKAYRIIRGDDEIIKVMERAVMHDDIWLESRRTVASNPFDALAIETFNGPKQSGLFIYNEQEAYKALFNIELTPGN